MAAFEAWLVFLILVVNVVGELQQKRTLAASRGFLAAARLSCLLVLPSGHGAFGIVIEVNVIRCNFAHSVLFNHHIRCIFMPFSKFSRANNISHGLIHSYVLA